MKNTFTFLTGFGLSLIGLLYIITYLNLDEIYQENKRNYIDTVGVIKYYGFDDVISCGNGMYYITLNDNSYKLYDNDFNSDINHGEELGKNIAEEFDLIFIQIPTKLQSKDTSDLCLKYGRSMVKKVIYKLINI